MPIDAKFHFARLRAGDGARMPVLRQELEGVLLPRLVSRGSPSGASGASGPACSVSLAMR